MDAKAGKKNSLRAAAEAEVAHAKKGGERVEVRHARELLHELQVHQIELEMQNEELRRAQAELENSRDRYVDFYDFSPVGYITLNHDSAITEINLTGAALLGMERSRLLSRNFAQIVSLEDRERWHLHFQSALNNDRKQSCEMRLLRGDEIRFFAQMDCLRVEKGGDEAAVRVVLTDISERKQLEKALQESELRYRTVADFTSDWEYWLMPDGTLRYMSPSCEEISGYTANEFYADPQLLTRIIHPDDAQLFAGHTHHQSAHGISCPIDFRIRCKSGETRWISHVCRPVYDPDGKPLGHRASNRDVTERKLAEERLRLSEAETKRAEEELQRFFKLIPDLACIASCDGHFLKVNPAWQEVLGYTEQEILATPILDFIHPDDRDATMKEVEHQFSGESIMAFSNRCRRKDGRYRWLEWRATAAMDGKLFASARDVTERKQADEQVHDQAYHDSLTRLPNRRLLSDRLEHIMVASKRSGLYCALMFLDMDNFKPLNDEYGHEAGDALLVEVARRISSCLREEDTVGRFGGDEFMVLLDELDADKAVSATQACTVAEKIRAILAEPYVIKIRHGGEPEATIEHRSTSSIGVVLFLNHEDSAEDIVKWADSAMYQAKEAGRNQINFYKAVGEELPAGA